MIDVNKRYKNKDKRVIDYMNNVMLALKEDYGKFSKSWLISLDILADDLELYYKGLDDVNQKGLYHVDERKRTSRNPQILVVQNMQDRICKLLSNFALTPMSKSKMKNLDTESADDYLEDLIN